MTAPKSAWQDTEYHHPVEPDPGWRELAACRGMGPDLFFPARGEQLQQAKAVCAECPVTAQCLEFSLSQPYLTAGVWGMASERERRRIRHPRTTR